VRVAIAGAHRTGKTTLIEALAARLPAYTAVEEPYHQLEEAGHEFADPPAIEDFEAQLRHALEAIAASGADTLFDRSPLDFVAYLRAFDDDHDLEPWRDGLRDALDSLDLVVVVPIEDRIPVPAHDDRALRRRVDELLATLIDDLDVATIEVHGDVDARVQQVLAAMRQIA
jgi:predicted ATPase